MTVALKDQQRLSITDLSAPPIKITATSASKIKKKNSKEKLYLKLIKRRIVLLMMMILNLALDRQAQMMSEEKLRKRNLFIHESQMMTTDVKNWWKTTLNDIDL